MSAAVTPSTEHNPRSGILLMLVAVVCFTALDGTAKLLVREYSIAEIVWGRYLFNLLLMAAFIPRLGIAGLVTTERPVLQIARGLLLLTSTASLFAALRFMPMADTYAITFVSPLIVAALSAPLLKERVMRSHWTAILCGFLGVIVIVRPGSGTASWAAVFALTMALSYALYQIMTRAMSVSEGTITTLFYTALVGSIAMSSVLPVVWRTPTVAAWALMAWMGLVGFIGQLLLFKALSLAPAALLSPFTYTQIVWATAIGYMLFGDVPDLATIAGSLIVIASGLYVLIDAARGRAVIAAWRNGKS